MDSIGSNWGLKVVLAAYETVSAVLVLGVKGLGVNPAIHGTCRKKAVQNFPFFYMRALTPKLCCQGVSVILLSYLEVSLLLLSLFPLQIRFEHGGSGS